MDVISPFISVLCHSDWLYHWLTFPWRVLSTYWCCSSRLCVVFLTCVHLELFLASSLSSGNSLVSSWCPRIQGWPHHGRTFSIYLSSVILIYFSMGSPVYALMLSIQAVRGLLAFVHLALFLASSLSPGNSLVSSWCDHSMLASLLWQCLTVSCLLQLC